MSFHLPPTRGPVSIGFPLALFLTFATLLMAAGPAAAVDKFAAEFLKVGVGARAMGMGGAFASIADDATAPYWNPAGLVQLEAKEAFGQHASQFGGVVNQNVLAFVAPLGSGSSRSALGATLIRLGVDDIKVTRDACRDADGDGQCDLDGRGNPIIDEDKVEQRSAYDLALLLSYAHGIGSQWGWGVNLKLIRQSLVGEGASFGIGADLGLLFRPSPRFALGLRLADITTTRLFWDTGREESVAPTVTMGAHTTQNLAALRGSITVGLDVNVAFEGQPGDQFTSDSGSLSGNVLPGLEYWFQRVAAVRLGSDGGNFTAGAGLRYKQVGADYAYLSHDELDATHRVSALVRF